MRATSYEILTVTGTLATFVLAVSIAVGQETTPPEPTDPAPVVTPDTDAGTTPTASTLNKTQQERVQRLSEASGATEAEILQLRNRTATPTDSSGTGTGTEPTEAPPQGRGWGVIARWLGLHPGVLGKGTGDKFVPEDGEAEVELPELPELPEESGDAVTTAQSQALERAEKKLSKEKGADGDDDDAAESAREKGKGNRDKARTSSEKGKADKDNSGKGNASDKSDKGNNGKSNEEHGNSAKGGKK